MPHGDDETVRAQRQGIRERVLRELEPYARPDTRFIYQIEHFIPDYPGTEFLVDALRELPFWQGDRAVYATPDNCLATVRSALLEENRPLLQTIAVRLGFRFFSPGTVERGVLRLAGTLDGADILSTPITLEEIQALGPLDVVISGCRAVNAEGVRLGKGHGYFDIEWGILSALGVVGEGTPIVIACHDTQVVDDVLEPLPNDTMVDWIITPTRTIEVDRKRPKPHGIDWDRLRPEQFAGMPPVRELKAMGL